MVKWRSWTASSGASGRSCSRCRWSRTTSRCYRGTSRMGRPAAPRRRHVRRWSGFRLWLSEGRRPCRAAPCARTGSHRGSSPRGCHAGTSTTVRALGRGSPSATPALCAGTSCPLTRCKYELGAAWWYVLDAIFVSENPHSLHCRWDILQGTEGRLH